MKKTIFALILAMTSLGAWAQTAPEQHYIEVNARAWREVSPDEIFLQITLDQNDSKGRYTLDALERQLHAAIERAGVDTDKFLKVSDLSSDLKSFLLRRADGRATKQYQLQVSGEQLMPVFEELDKAGISNIQLQSTRYSRRAELYDELLGEAVATARRRAAIMATADGAQAGKMVFLQTYDNSAAYEAPMARAQGFVMASMAEEADMKAPALEFQTTRIEVNVTARFEL